MKYDFYMQLDAWNGWTSPRYHWHPIFAKAPVKPCIRSLLVNRPPCILNECSEDQRRGMTPTSSYPGIHNVAKNEGNVMTWKIYDSHLPSCLLPPASLSE